MHYVWILDLDPNAVYFPQKPAFLDVFILIERMFQIVLIYSTRNVTYKASYSQLDRVHQHLSFEYA